SREGTHRDDPELLVFPGHPIQRAHDVVGVDCGPLRYEPVREEADRPLSRFLGHADHAYLDTVLVHLAQRHRDRIAGVEVVGYALEHVLGGHTELVTALPVLRLTLDEGVLIGARLAKSDMRVDDGDPVVRGHTVDSFRIGPLFRSRAVMRSRSRMSRLASTLPV